MDRGNRAWCGICVGLLVLGVCAVMPALAAAKRNGGGEQPVAGASDGRGGVKGGEPAEQRPARVRFLDSGSGETKAVREKRLKRECKGRPNAGACLGMTR